LPGSSTWNFTKVLIKLFVLNSDIIKIKNTKIRPERNYTNKWTSRQRTKHKKPVKKQQQK
jgi:hypothetical protein